MNNKYLRGFDEADAVLRDLPDAVENRVLQKATRAGGNVWRKLLRAAAPKHSGKQSPASAQYGTLVRNIKTAVLRKAKAKGRRGVRVSTGAGFWGMFLEFGTRFIAARPWFRPTVEASRDEVEAAMAKKTTIELDREVKRLVRKHRVK